MDGSTKHQSDLDEETKSRGRNDDPTEMSVDGHVTKNRSMCCSSLGKLE